MRDAVNKLKAKFVLLWFVGTVGFVVATAPVYPREQSVSPGINKHYENAVYEEWVQRFEREGREIYDKRHEIVTALALREDMVVADIGAGTGLFARLFSPEVGPGGRVIAVDISRQFIDKIVQIAKEQGQENIQGIVNTPTDTALPPASIDLAFVCDTYHHFEYPETMLRSLHRALRRDGTLVVIDYRRVNGLSSPWVMNHVRAGEDTVVGEIEAAGFRLAKTQDLLRENYFLQFKKCDDACVK